MKRNDYSNYSKGQEVSGVTFQQHQNQVIESLNTIMQSLGLDSTEITVLWGLNQTISGADRIISEGAVFTNGEIFQVDSFTGPDNEDTLILSPVSLEVGNPVRFGDGTFRSVHNDHKYLLAVGTPGGSSIELEGLLRLEDKLIDLVGAETYTNLQISNIVEGEQYLDTLKKLADAVRNVGGGKSNQSSGASINYVSPTNIEQKEEDGDITINNAVIPASDLTVLSGGKRVVHLFCDFAYAKEGSDNDEFTAQLMYKEGSGGWNVLRGRRLIAIGGFQVGSIRAQLTLVNSPTLDLQFGLRIIHHDLSIYISTPSTIEFDAIY